MHFGDFQPSNPRVVTDRGFAFLEVDAEQMEAAIQALDNSTLGGRNIRVSKALPREDRGPRPSGGGGGGGFSRDRGGFGGGGGGGRDRGGYGGGGGGGRDRGGRGRF